MHASGDEGLLHLGSGRFNPLSGDLVLDGRTVRLRPRTAALLAELLRHRDRMLTKDELMAAVWPDAVVTEDSLVQCVKEIRHALGPGGRDWIRTLPRQGYVFIGPTADDAASAPAAAHQPHRRRGAAILGVAALVAALVLGLAWRAGSPQQPASLVVLPLSNLTGEPSHELTADDLTEALTDALARTAGTVVIASATAFTFKGRPVDVREVGAGLDVRYVLQGSLRMEDSTPVLAMRMVDAGTAVQLWTHEFRAASVRELREQVAGRVAGSLGVQLIGAGRGGAEQPPATLRGAALLAEARGMLQDATVSADEFAALERAVASQAVRAAARAGSPADAWATAATFVMAEGRFRAERDTQLRRAGAATLRALELDPDSEAAVLAYGLQLYERGHMAQALAALDRVVELNPNHAVGHGFRGAAMIMLGRPGDALAAVDQALRISPRDRWVPGWQMFAGTAHLHLGHDAMAVDWLTRSLEHPVTPASPPMVSFSRLFLASALANAGRLDEARAALALFQQKFPRFTLADFQAREPSKVPAFLAQRERLYDGLRRAGIRLQAEPTHPSPARASAGHWVGQWVGSVSQGALEMVLEVDGNTITGRMRSGGNAPGCSDGWREVSGAADGAQVVATSRRPPPCGTSEYRYTIDATGTVMTGTWTSEWPANGTLRMTRQADAAGAPAGTASAARD